MARTIIRIFDDTTFNSIVCTCGGCSELTERGCHHTTSIAIQHGRDAQSGRDLDLCRDLQLGRASDPGRDTRPSRQPEVPGVTDPPEEVTAAQPEAQQSLQSPPDHAKSASQTSPDSSPLADCAEQRGCDQELANSALQDGDRHQPKLAPADKPTGAVHERGESAPIGSPSDVSVTHCRHDRAIADPQAAGQSAGPVTTDSGRSPPGYDTGYHSVKSSDGDAVEVTSASSVSYLMAHGVTASDITFPPSREKTAAGLKLRRCESVGSGDILLRGAKLSYAAMRNGLQSVFSSKSEAKLDAQEEMLRPGELSPQSSDVAAMVRTPASLPLQQHSSQLSLQHGLQQGLQQGCQTSLQPAQRVQHQGVFAGGAFLQTSHRLLTGSESGPQQMLHRPTTVSASPAPQQPQRQTATAATSPAPQQAQPQRQTGTATISPAPQQPQRQAALAMCSPVHQLAHRQPSGASSSPAPPPGTGSLVGRTPAMSRCQSRDRAPVQHAQPLTRSVQQPQSLTAGSPAPLPPQSYCVAGMHKPVPQRQVGALHSSQLRIGRVDSGPMTRMSPQAAVQTRHNSPPVKLVPHSQALLPAPVPLHPQGASAAAEEQASSTASASSHAPPPPPPQTPPQRDVGYSSAWAEIPSRSYHAKVANVTAERPGVVSPAAAAAITTSQYWNQGQAGRAGRGEPGAPVNADAAHLDSTGSSRSGMSSAECSLQRSEWAVAASQARHPPTGESDREVAVEEECYGRSAVDGATADCGRLSGSTTAGEPPAACSTLDKSSSDNDAASLSRKRPPNKLKSRRRNILSFPTHLNADDLRSQRRREPYGGGSSSDENRSSGHASMSDGHTSSSPPAETLPRHEHYRSQLRSVPEGERVPPAAATPGPAPGPARGCRTQRALPLRAARHRTKDDLTLHLESASGLDDIRQAIEQLTLRSQGSRTSYSTSTYSSMSGSESEPVRRLIRHSSLETVNTTASAVTAADEFVWVDSHNRLVELQQLPWSNHDVLRVIQNGRVKDQMERVSMETVPRLSYLLQRALVRVAREAQRLARALGMCSKQEVLSALCIVLSPTLSDTCRKACLRAAAMYTVSGAEQLRQSKTDRAGLQLSVGRFHRWMCDVRIGKFIHEYAAVYLAAGMENLLEEMVLLSLPGDTDSMLTASVLEHAIASSGDCWGLLQPYAHLNSGRTASGALSLPRFPSTGSLDSAQSQSVGRSSTSSSLTLTAGDDQRPARNIQQALLTTCVGSVTELSELVARVGQYQQRISAGSTPSRATVAWGPSALHTLFYFMRCSQLEHAEHAEEERRPVQELVYERPYVVLPPLVEWFRVSTAHAQHRHASVVDKDDVNQAARLLLPGVDCPPRLTGYEELSCPRLQMDEVECANKFKVDLAFRMLSCGRTDLVPHALQLLPNVKGQLAVNTMNESGLSPLMLACVRGDEAMVRLLLDSGSDVDMETPPLTHAHPTANPETQHWTALTYATIHGHCGIVSLLLEKGANVEGGARLSEDKCTETPLQVASASGSKEIVSLLLSYNALPFLSTLLNDSLCYSGAAQKGCYSAISVSAAHGQRTVLHQLLSHPLNSGRQQVLSLEEILAEGSTPHQAEPRANRLQVQAVSVDEPRTSSLGSRSAETSQMLKLTKPQVKALQEAMYHSAEHGHLEITLDLRNLGVPWTLHCWMHTLATAHEQRLENIIDQLLQDFLQVWPEDFSSQFVDECLLLLFNIFRYSKNEGTSLLLADIFSSCFGREPIKETRDSTPTDGPRIDPNFVNNPDLSDVQFRVEGRVFFAHKIILINASPRFQQMLNSKLCDGNPPIVQINDIRYEIFELVMHFLYKGDCEQLVVGQQDVLELMAAANFFQLEKLLRFCETRCAKLVDLENIVSMYIHAKVYSATQLLEFCQGFLLQNMVALLTYDDSVRRLIFGKKLHNHDVLAGLQLTLQNRIRGKAKPAS